MGAAPSAGGCTARSIALTDSDDAVREQASLRVAVERRERVPQVRCLLRQRLAHAGMARIDGRGERAVGKAGRLRGEADALQVELQAGVLRVAVEHAQAERVERCEERDVGTSAERVAQRQRAMRGQLGHQPVGQRLEPLVLVRLDDGAGLVTRRDRPASSAGCARRRAAPRVAALRRSARARSAARPRRGHSRARPAARPSLSMLTNAPARATSAASNTSGRSSSAAIAVSISPSRASTSSGRSSSPLA